jgi:hypothetical protein
MEEEGCDLSEVTVVAVSYRYCAKAQKMLEIQYNQFFWGLVTNGPCLALLCFLF